MAKGRLGLLEAGLLAIAVLLAIAAATVLHPSDPPARIVVTLAIGLGLVVAADRRRIRSRS